MVVDDAGLLWIANVWLAVGFLLVAVGVALFSHGWIVAGRPPRPRRMAVRMRRGARQPTDSAPIPLPARRRASRGRNRPDRRLVA